MRTQQEDSIFASGKQGSAMVSWQLSEQIAQFVGPLLVQLDTIIDKRLVRTLLATLQVIIQFRNRSHSLLLSELGGYLLSADQAPAGTKRLSNLLRCTKWQYSLIERFLWSRAQQRVAALQEQQEDVLALWDESVLEKSESIQVEGLCAVRSSKAARLKRIKPGYFNPPGGRPIFVPGMHWLSVLFVGTREKSGPPTVAAMRRCSGGLHEGNTPQRNVLTKSSYSGSALTNGVMLLFTSLTADLPVGPGYS